ncbi:hypothetical protein [Desulfosporosinus lacus]|nr:hypothetical protein [Desulfosporosinus lacus]
MKTILSKAYAVILATLFTLLASVAPVLAAADSAMSSNGVPVRIRVYIVAGLIAIIVILAITTTHKENN